MKRLAFHKRELNMSSECMGDQLIHLQGKSNEVLKKKQRILNSYSVSQQSIPVIK